METLEFIALIAGFAVILVWYIQNAVADSDGYKGILALINDPIIGKRGAYKVKSRATRRSHESLIHDQRDNKDEAAAPIQKQATYNNLEQANRMRSKFRRQNETRYKVKDRKPRP